MTIDVAELGFLSQATFRRRGALPDGRTRIQWIFSWPPYEGVIGIRFTYRAVDHYPGPPNYELIERDFMRDPLWPDLFFQSSTVRNIEEGCNLFSFDKTRHRGYCPGSQEVVCSASMTTAARSAGCSSTPRTSSRPSAGRRSSAAGTRGRA